MKLLLVTRCPPSLGGLETMGMLIAREWEGISNIMLKVVTDVPGPVLPELKAELVRSPSLRQLHQLYAWADVVFFNHCYLKLSLPLLWCRKPYVLSMSGTLDTLPHHSLRQRIVLRLLQKMLEKASANIAACDYVKDRNAVPAEVIPNPFDSAVYHSTGNEERPMDFFFGGRVNQAAKGCLDLIDALVECRQATGRQLTLSVAGDGPDLREMKARVEAAGLSKDVRFLGVLRGSELAAEMRRHRIIVVPSRYQEPIGIICLEGIACGCIAIGSSGGGLGQTVGSCGFTFSNGDTAGLASAMTQAASLDSAACITLRQHAEAHLAGYLPAPVAARYLAVAQRVGPRPGLAARLNQDQPN